MIKLNQAYYKTLTGFFKTEKTDIDFLKNCFLNKLKNNNVEKYFDLWTQEKYQELCNEIHNDINN